TNDRVSNETPDSYPARNQFCHIEQVVQHHTSKPKSDPADIVGVRARLDEHRTQGLKGERVGSNGFQVCAPERYLNKCEENVDGKKDGIDDPGSEIAD